MLLPGKSSMNPDLVKTTEIFLVPSSFLVAALGTGDSNPHRAAVSVLALVISVLWFICSHEATAEHDAASPTSARTARRRIFYFLPLLFVAGWLFSLVVHLMLWNDVKPF